MCSLAPGATALAWDWSLPMSAWRSAASSSSGASSAASRSTEALSA